MQEGEGSIGGKSLRRCNGKSGTQGGRWPSYSLNTPTEMIEGMAGNMCEMQEGWSMWWWDNEGILI